MNLFSAAGLLLAAGALLGPLRPADAQVFNLHDGDSLSVSAAGTHGTYRGKAIDNATTSYSGMTVNNAPVYLRGGDFTLGAGGSLIGDPATTDGIDIIAGVCTVTGGVFSGFYGADVSDSGVLNITGGQFSGGPQGAALVAQSSGLLGLPGSPGDGVINLYGTFLLHPAGSSISGISAGLLVGTLQDGESIATNYEVDNGTINFFAPVPPGDAGTVAPEPSQAAGLGLGVLGLAGLVFRRRRAGALA